MKVLFILEDNFPASGACTNLLNKIIFEGGMIKTVSSIDVLAVKSGYTPNKTEQINGIIVRNCVLLSKVPIKQYKHVILKHPFKMSRVILKKIFFVYKKRNDRLIKEVINKDNVKAIEKALKEIKSNDYDAVIAVMGRFDIAYAAMKFKKKNSDVGLVIYQVDPCSGNEMYSSSVKGKLEEFEEKLYTVSDVIITTPILFRAATEEYPDEILDKMTTMEFPNVVPCTKDKQRNSDKIKCIFTGNIYGSFRDPEYTLRLFDGVDSKVSFEIIGSVKDDFKDEFAGHRVLHHGVMPLDETRKELLDADILVNIGNKMQNQVPSKLFEYISYGKPIINICKNRNCPTIPYLEKYKYALNLYEEDDIFEEQVKQLNDFILKNYRSRMTAEEILKEFETCTPQYCANQMLDVLNAL